MFILTLLYSNFIKLAFLSRLFNRIMFNFQITFHYIILLVFGVDILVIGRKLFKKTEKEEERKLSFIDRKEEDEENKLGLSWATLIICGLG